MRSLVEQCVALLVSDDDPAWIQIVIKGLALAKEFRSEDDVRCDHLHGAVGLTLAVGESLPHRSSVANRDGGLDDHHGVRIDLQYHVYHLFHVRGVEEILLTVVIGRGGYHHEVRIPVGCLAVKGSGEHQGLCPQVFLDIIVLYRRYPVVDFVNLFRYDIHCRHLVLL